MDGISLQAIFYKAQKTKDGGWIISFEVSKDETHAVAQTSLYDDCLLQLGIVPFDAKGDQ